MPKNESVAQWMDANGLTLDGLAKIVRHSHGAVAKWRQEISYPFPRTERKIRLAEKRHGWTPFPSRRA